MTLRPTLAAILFTAGLGAAARADDARDLLGKAREHFRALPSNMEKGGDSSAPARIRLGRALFFEPRMSVDGTTSCSRCHLPQLQATDSLPKSIGSHDFHLQRNAPTVFNAAIHGVQHWDGRFATVEEQARAGVSGPAFGNDHFGPVKSRLRAIPGYEALFREAFPGQQDPITDANVGEAVGSFERTLVSPSRFDAYLAGQVDALSLAEQQGLRTFLEIGCVDCHRGVGVGGEGFRKFGVLSEYWKETGGEPDEGRFVITHDPADRYKFKVPGLRNVALTAPYFHDGSVADLPRAVRVMAKVQLNEELAAAEVDGIIVFLGTLTGERPATFEPPALPPAGFSSKPLTSSPDHGH